jgi:hypothetical protein
MKIGTKVEAISDNSFTGRIGRIFGKGKEAHGIIEYCVQFYKPTEWCFFRKEELRKVK